MKWQGFRNQSASGIGGDLLVADFHSAVVNLVTKEVAHAEAQRSEEEITAALQYAAGGGAGLISPRNIAPEAADSLMKTSVDAHLKKVQADQINRFTSTQVAQLQADDLQKYKGRKIRVTRLDADKDTFHSLWADKYSGQLRPSNFTGQSVTGIVEDLSFEQNTLVLVPTLASRMINPGRKYYLVHVVSLATMQPAVKIDLI